MTCCSNTNRHGKAGCSNIANACNKIICQRRNATAAWMLSTHVLCCAIISPSKRLTRRQQAITVCWWNCWRYYAALMRSNPNRLDLPKNARNGHGTRQGVQCCRAARKISLLSCWWFTHRQGTKRGAFFIVPHIDFHFLPLPPCAGGFAGGFASTRMLALGAGVPSLAGAVTGGGAAVCCWNGLRLETAVDIWEMLEQPDKDKPAANTNHAPNCAMEFLFHRISPDKLL